MQEILKASLFTIELRRCDFVHEDQERWWRAHGRAGLLDVNKEHQAACIVVDLRQDSLVAIGQARRRLRVHSIDATKELPLLPASIRSNCRCER